MLRLPETLGSLFRPPRYVECVPSLSHSVTDTCATAGPQKAWFGAQRFVSITFFQCRILLSPCPPHFLVPCMRFTAPKHVRFSSVPSLPLTQNSCWGLQQIHTCTSHVTAICSQCSPRTFLVAHGHLASPALPFQVPASQGHVILC